jgi:hypothetical protein
MADVWMGDITCKKAIANDELKLVGPKALTKDISS